MNTPEKGVMTWMIAQRPGWTTDAEDYQFPVNVDVDTLAPDYVPKILASVAKQLTPKGLCLIVSIQGVFGSGYLFTIRANRFTGPNLSLRLEWEAPRIRLFIDGTLVRDVSA